MKKRALLPDDINPTTPERAAQPPERVLGFSLPSFLGAKLFSMTSSCAWALESHQEE